MTLYRAQPLVIGGKVAARTDEDTSLSELYPQLNLKCFLIALLVSRYILPEHLEPDEHPRRRRDEAKQRLALREQGCLLRHDIPGPGLDRRGIDDAVLPRSDRADGNLQMKLLLECVNEGVAARCVLYGQA